MYFLDADFFTALPGIILGMICMGVVCFLLFGLMSKATGKSIGYRGGLTYKGGTLANPDTLDIVGGKLREVVDVKYKNKKQIQRDFNEELTKAISPIDIKILMIQRNIRYIPKHYRYMYEEKEINPDSRFNFLGYSSKEQEGYDIQMEILQKEKQNITNEIKLKYAMKLALIENPERSIKNTVQEPKSFKETTNQNKNNVSLSDEIKKLSELFNAGIITKDQFEDAKNKLIKNGN